MKKLTYLLLIFAVLSTMNVLRAQQVIVTDDALYTTPAAGAVLDVNSTSKGFLPPRIALTGTNDVTTIPALTNGLLIYNTSSVSDVTPGYYYWAEAWVRISGSNEPAQPIQQNSVTKNQSTTLLKTDNVVFASGDITLTLPVISLEDDGLEIYVKNVGTHTDLITVVAQEGKRIDNFGARNLMRWEGKTFIAKGSNWVLKEKNRDDSNALVVHPAMSFTSIKEVIEFLNEHMDSEMLIRLCCGEHLINETITIDLPYSLTIEGLSFGTSNIIVASGVTAFDVKTETYFKQFTFTGASTSSNAIALSGENTYYEIKDGFFQNLNKGVSITNSGELWLFEVDFIGCVTAGVEVAAGTGDVFLKTSESDFLNCGKGIHLVSAGPQSQVSILNSTFYNEQESQSGIHYVPTTGTNNFRFNSMIIQNNSYNRVGNFASGFDFSLSSARDANIFFENNAGVSSGRPHCNIYVSDNSTATSTGSQANAWVLLNNFSSYTSSTTKFTIGNNIITYQPLNARDGLIYITGDLKVSSNGVTVSIGIVKNGNTNTVYGKTSVFAKFANEPVQFSTVAYVGDVLNNTNFRIYISSASTNTNVTINNLNWYTETH